MSKRLSLVFVLAQFVFLCGNVSAQGTNNSQNNRAITTAVPFIILSPDARGSSLGDAGVATSPDALGTFWNPAKMAFVENSMGGSISVTPWLRSLGLNDLYLSYLSGYYKLRREDAISVSLSYFSMGRIEFTDIANRPAGDFNPNELAFSVAYSRQLSEYFSVGVGGRLIHSNLTGNFTSPNGMEGRPATGAAVDLSAYYSRPIVLGGNGANIAFGANLSNIGPKISYSNLDRRDFIPTNLRVGTAFTVDMDAFNKLTFVLDANKLLVPTPPIRENNSSNGAIIAGREDNVPLFTGMIQSFYDAPGGFREEMQEITLGGGIEYWYDNLFAVRGGYYNEHRDKGARKYFSAGVGIRYQMFGLDLSYLIPMRQNNPLAETLRISILLNFNRPSTVRESVTD
jgi:hypothetical protein